MLTKQTEIKDLLILEARPVRATAGQRFANYLIDIVLFYAIIFAISIAIFMVSPSTIENMDTESSGMSGLLDRLIAIFLYGLNMGIVETVFKGKSLGKLITGTRAVNMDGTKISVSTAFARGFSRAVPFCVFSAFGTPCNPWQDKWTNTMVIDEKKSTF